MKRLRLIAGGMSAGILIGALSLYAMMRVTGHGHDHDHKAGIEHTDSDAAHEHQHEHGDDASGHTHGKKEAKGDHAGEGEHAHDHDGGHGEDEEEHEGKVAIAAAQIAEAEISVAPANAGLIRKRLRVAGTVIPDRNRVGRVPAKVIGTVAELRKRLGDEVAAGEVIAVLDSREVADAKSEYIAALVNYRLQETLHEREKTLWEKQVSSEQRLLRMRATFEEATVRRDVARQKLSALGVNDEAIARLSESGQPPTGLERYEIKAPMSGRIVEQLVDVGTPMGGEGQAHELYAITDLSTVWIELTVSPQDLPQIDTGQSLTIEASSTGARATGTIIFTSPMLNLDTRSARVIASVENREGLWRPGTFVTAEIAVSESEAPIVVPKAAIQKIKGEDHVFVRTPEGFEARPVKVGHDDGTSVAIASGLEGGEPVATANTFLLKAELGKAEAEHVH